MKVFRWFLIVGVVALCASPASAQVQTGAVTGIVTDASGGVLPGATASLSGEKLIGGVQSEVTDTTGSFRFSRLPPGNYTLKVELQGFKAFERSEIRVDAAFVATVNVRLEVGSLNESVTVTGESPTVDTKSNLQQTIMGQEILEGVPSGRDPWSVAKIIPGVQISTYDVGGTQSFQQSSLSAHGSSTNDVSYNIDGATVNWPGGGGGATMLYYDQGMFEEVNYMTSAIPAEVMAGGVSINMVTKDAGNKWRGNFKGFYTTQNLQSDNTTASFLPTGFPGNPTKNLYDANVAGGGALIRDRLWVNGSIRRWVVNKFVAAKNPDGSQALDDNTLKNYSGKAVFSANSDQKLSFSYNYNNKIRGHRRDTPPDIVPDIASLVQGNPASSTQAKYTGIFGKKTVFESSFSLMSGETDYSYQPNTPPTAVRAVDSVLDTAAFAAQRQEEQPNSRLQFDNILSYSTTGMGGDHLIKGGVQFARLYFDDRYDVLNDMYLNYTNGKPTSVSEYNTPIEGINIDRLLGVFLQDSYTVNKLTVNVGVRFDHNIAILPAQSTTGGQFIGPQSIPESTPVNQNLFVWRTGLVFDPVGDGQTALKASYSRYGLQVGIDRATNVNPLSAGSRTCPWTDNGAGGGIANDGIAQPGEIQTAQCTAFPTLKVHYASANGPNWPYSDEVTAGIERQVMKDMRVGVMYYYRTNRNQIGTTNPLVPSSYYVPITVNIPNGPNGPTTATVYNLASAAYNSLSSPTLDNQSYLDTNYSGVEFTANKRFSHRWQMVAGLTVGKNKGGLNAGGTGSGQSTTADLNDPNNLTYSNGVIGNDSLVAFRLSGSYMTPGSISISGSMISNGGFPYVSTYSVTRTLVPTLVRSSQTVFLSDRGDERLPTVTMVDLAISRAFKFPGGRQIVPRLEIFNIGNASTVVTLNPAVGSTNPLTGYLAPTQIVSPRIFRLGVNIDF